MALYNNNCWILSHIRNSFISADDTGLSEVVMIGTNLCKRFPEYCPGIDENDEEDEDSARSLDNYSDLEFGLRRQRSNTHARLEKMEKERREGSNTTRIKWTCSRPFSAFTDEEKEELFREKPLDETAACSRNRKISLLTVQLEKSLHLPVNPFQEYAKFDGDAQVGIPTRTYGIFMHVCEEDRNYPVVVTVITTAKVNDFIGLILLKHSIKHPDHNFKNKPDYYCLRITEEDGEVDCLFHCLDSKELISKFDFQTFALVEREVPSEVDSGPCNSAGSNSDVVGELKDNRENADEEVSRLQDLTAIEASLYKCYKVSIINKVKAKTEVHLGISGQKVDIDPILKPQSIGSKFLARRKPITYHIDCIVACDLTETKASKSTFRLVYDSLYATEGVSQTPAVWANFKHHDFECERHTAEEIAQKLNHIMELRCGLRRKEYVALRERKSHRRRSFHFGPR